MKVAAIALAAALVVASPAAARDLSGPAQVIDGDSLVVDGQQIRLQGIDAPEWRQICQRDGADWHAGQEAAAFLRSLADGKSVACSQDDYDSHYHRVVGTCYLAGTNLNQAMVESGWAVAYRRYSTRYVEVEQQARKAGKGIWQGECQTPEDWRRGHPKTE